MHIPFYFLGHRSERVHVCTGHDLHVQAAERVRLAVILLDHCICSRHWHALYASLLPRTSQRIDSKLAIMPSSGWWRYLNPGPFNIKEHTVIVIMSSTASTVAIAMEIIAALGPYSLSTPRAAALVDLDYQISSMISGSTRLSVSSRFLLRR